jgi:hypothetical protein
MKKLKLDLVAAVIFTIASGQPKTPHPTPVAYYDMLGREMSFYKLQLNTVYCIKYSNNEYRQVIITIQ